MKAPIPTNETIIPMLRAARRKRELFLYRITPAQKAPLALDAAAVDAILDVYDAANDSIRKQMRALAPDAGHLAMACLTYISKLKEISQCG